MQTQGPPFVYRQNKPAPKRTCVYLLAKTAFKDHYGAPSKTPEDRTEFSQRL